MKPIEYLLLFLLMLRSFEMIAQDTLSLNAHQKGFVKAASLQEPEMLSWNAYLKQFTETVSLQDPEMNTMVLNYPRGSDDSTVIYFGRFNVPRYAVRVMAGNQQLQEGIDYTVNYQIGTVQILDPSFAANKVPIHIAVKE